MDYKKLKLKAGLEIHQQLDTHKLFCSCPSLLRNDEPKKIIKRELNPVAGETGEIDIAAQYEKTQNKNFFYEVYDTNCLVELDEEPPHDLNDEAMKIALQIALLLNCEIFPATQVMRKTVVDGSNTSGFQRTLLIAHDGFIETSEGKVGIETIALEEDSARKISSEKNHKTFRLDRLGIPLVEITTKPDLKSPQQIKEAALKIGEILRATKVKRGIGTIRQDLNISTTNHPRVEIKGFQEPKIMLKTIEEEIKRQQENLDEKAHVRKSLPNGKTEFLRPMPSAARMYPETDTKLIQISREKINDAKTTLPKLASENKSYLKEFGLNDELITLILKQNKLKQFKILSETTKNYNLLGKILTLFQKEIAKKQKISQEELDKKLNTDILEELLKKIEEGKISENEIKPILQKLAEGKSLNEATKKESINKQELEKEIEKIIKEKPNLSQGAYMGLLMSKFKGKANGKEISDALNKFLKK